MFEDFKKSHKLIGSIRWEKCKNLNCNIFSVDFWWDSYNLSLKIELIIEINFTDINSVGMCVLKGETVST